MAAAVRDVLWVDFLLPHLLFNFACNILAASVPFYFGGEGRIDESLSKSSLALSSFATSGRSFTPECL